MIANVIGTQLRNKYTILTSSRRSFSITIIRGTAKGGGRHTGHMFSPPQLWEGAPGAPRQWRDKGFAVQRLQILLHRFSQSKNVRCHSQKVCCRPLNVSCRPLCPILGKAVVWRFTVNKCCARHGAVSLLGYYVVYIFVNECCFGYLLRNLHDVLLWIVFLLYRKLVGSKRLEFHCHQDEDKTSWMLDARAKLLHALTQQQQH